MAVQARRHRCVHNLHDLTHTCVNIYTRTRAHTPAIYHALETDFPMKTSSSESRAEIQTGPFFPVRLLSSPSRFITLCTSFVLFMFSCLSLLSHCWSTTPNLWLQAKTIPQTNRLMRGWRKTRHAKLSVTVLLSVVIYIRNDNMGKRTTAMQNEKGCVWRRGKEREEEGVNPVTGSVEHSGVVRGLYKTLSMNDSKHLNDRKMGRCVCVCVWLLGDNFNGSYWFSARWVNTFTT